MSAQTDPLDATVTQYLQLGYRLETRTANQVVLLTGRRINHILHLILTILTLGLWGIVWIIMGIAGGQRRVIFTVDEHGRVQENRARG